MKWIELTAHTHSISPQQVSESHTSCQHSVNNTNDGLSFIYLERVHSQTFKFFLFSPSTSIKWKFHLYSGVILSILDKAWNSSGVGRLCRKYISWFNWHECDVDSQGHQIPCLLEIRFVCYLFTFSCLYAKVFTDNVVYLFSQHNLLLEYNIHSSQLKYDKAFLWFRHLQHFAS